MTITILGYTLTVTKASQPAPPTQPVEPTPAAPMLPLSSGQKANQERSTDFEAFISTLK
jgi:hypothetical protein